MKAKGILIIAVACFVVASVAAISWGLCQAWVQVVAENTNQLPQSTDWYQPCEEWLIWEFDFWFWDDPGEQIIATYTTPTDFFEIYYSYDLTAGMNHFEGYVWDDHQSHETGIAITTGGDGGHFYDMDLCVHYAASQPDR